MLPMRLFIALSLPDEVHRELALVQARLRGLPVRWSGPAGIHLTLQFIGETAEQRAPELLAALAALPAAPLTLQLEGLGAFPDLRRPRVIWAGLGGDLAALSRLQAAVLATTAPLGFALEERPFRPHLTLGRVRQEAGPEERQALGRAIERAEAPAPLAWQAGGPTLFQSALTPAGAVYTALGPGHEPTRPPH
jgi:2'-5' RNA ligase